MMNLQPAATMALLANGRDQQTLTYCHGIILWILVAYLNPKDSDTKAIPAISMFIVIDLKLPYY